MTRTAAPRLLRVAALTMPVLLCAAAASAQVGYTGSLYFVRVDTADGSRTDAVYGFSSVDFEFRRLRATATFPVIAQQSEWVDPTLGPVESGWSSGIADPTFRLDAEVWRSRLRSTSVRMSGTVKVPVASVDEGYSSGKADVALGASISTFRGRNNVAADVTYWILGDPSELDYRNVPSFYAGYARVLDGQYKWSGIVALSGAPSAIPGLEPSVQVSLALLRVLKPGAALGISFDIGLTDASADLAVGSTWRFAF